SVDRVEPAACSRENADHEEPGRGSEPAVEPDAGEGEDEDDHGELESDACEFACGKAAAAFGTPVPRACHMSSSGTSNPLESRLNPTLIPVGKIGACEFFLNVLVKNFSNFSGATDPSRARLRRAPGTG